MSLEITYNGYGCKLNSHLIKRQGLTEADVLRLKELHLERLKIEDKMRSAPVVELKGLFQQWTQNEFLLQDVWKFPRNQNFHRFWDLPNRACTCPDLDNEDNWPTGYYVMNSDCPIHGT